MVACSAEGGDRVAKQAKQVGFDKCLMSPLTENMIKELVLEIEKKYYCTESLFED